MVNKTGIDELADELDQMTEQALGLEDSNEVPVTELMTPTFMSEYTDFSTFEDFIEASEWTVESQADFEAIPEDEFDEHVAEHTQFTTWEAMLSQAGEEWAARQLR